MQLEEECNIDKRFHRVCLQLEIYNAEEMFLILLLRNSDGGQTEPYLIDPGQRKISKLSLEGNACMPHAKIPLRFRISLSTSHNVETRTTDRLFPPKTFIPSLRQRAERSRLQRAGKGQTVPSI
ncbi:Uncharacterized protein DAT39_019946 [Clarias magur]|uniref:Uncharacterized protein n=1 Tax=Clarias magur TaxID=1594786 RepID=A0A8J4U3Y9_CLAMG|nr:Uncharacterized protein DAT39_019946 [Clarias magur]